MTDELNVGVYRYDACRGGEAEEAVELHESATAPESRRVSAGLGALSWEESTMVRHAASR